MATTEPPSLPYARDEASTSYHLSNYSAYPTDTYPPASSPLENAEIDDEVLADGDPETAGNTDGQALQYWTSKRHMSGLRSERGDDEYGEYIVSIYGWQIRER